MAGGINDFVPNVVPGDPLSADWANRLVDNFNRGNTFIRSRMGVIRTAAGDYYYEDYQGGILYFNGDATTVPAFGVVIDNGVKAAGSAEVAPQTMRSTGYGCQNNFYVNGAEPVPANDWGEAQDGTGGGSFIVAWDTQDGFTPAKNEMWGVQSGSYLIRKNYAGFRVVGVYDSTRNLVLVRSHPCYTIRGKPTPSGVVPGASGALNVFVGAYGSEAQPAGNPQITNVRNDSSCTIQMKMSRIMYNPDNGLFQWTDAYTA